jgi:hypothetical protein
VDEFNARYAAVLGATVETNRFDGGERVTIRFGHVAYTAVITYGDEVQVNRRILKWLHTLPWPQEDDPRVEGAYK